MTLNEFRNQVADHAVRKLRELKIVPPDADFTSNRIAKRSTSGGECKIVCLANLEEAKTKYYSYWFTLTRGQHTFLEEERAQDAWIVLGCRSVNDILCIPMAEFSKSSWSHYILESNGWNFRILRNFTLYISNREYRGPTIDLSKYLLRNFKP